MAASKTRGYFITLEGAEGTGKSTQCRLLDEVLTSSGIAVVATREPGGSPGAEEIRKLLVEGTVDRWDAMSEVLLLLAARRDHVTRTIQPALDRGAWVICDRFSDSTLAYQGYGHGIDLGLLRNLSRQVLGEFLPDLTLILDVPVETGLQRTAARQNGEDRYERMKLAFHERLRQGFLAIAQEDSDRCHVVDASQDIETVHLSILNAVSNRFPEFTP